MNKTSKKFVLSVQGEGRGHVTQAMVLYDLLTESGHEVQALILGSGGAREIPQYLIDHVRCPILQLRSPNFVCDKQNKSINITRTLFYNLARVRQFRQSLREIDQLLERLKPDTVINLFDLLMGLYYRFYRPKAKMICLAHQYIYFHKEFEFPKGRMLDRLAIKYYSRLTAHGSIKNLGLSFYKLHTHDDDVVVVPPLLRKEIFEMESIQDDFYLVYLVNSGYFEEIIQWHLSRPDVQIHCFTDHPDVLRQRYVFDDTKLCLHRINDKTFLQMMSRSKGLASTAGFESVCEAMYLGKPVLLVPIEGHYEQFCNSRDAYRAGAGIFADRFDLGRLENYILGQSQQNAWFKTWVSSARHRIYNEIISA